MKTRSNPAFLFAVCLALLFATIVVLRGGLLFWLGLVVSCAWAIKIHTRPAQLDLAIIAGIGASFTACAAGIGAFVLATWESVEVVTIEVPINGDNHSVRTWIMDDNDTPWIIYDAGANVADVLLEEGVTINLTRADTTMPHSVTASLYEEMTAEESAPLLKEYLAKYGEVDFINNVFYALLGRARGRVVLILHLKALP